MTATSLPHNSVSNRPIFEGQSVSEEQKASEPREQGPLALVVAAGSGQRFGSDLPKQYHKINATRVLTLTLAHLFAASRCRAAVVVIHPDYRAHAEAAISDLGPGLAKACHLAHGGASRQESVRLGLEALAIGLPGAVLGEASPPPSPRSLDDLVLIHDAARPLLGPEAAHRLLNAALEIGASVPLLPVADTLKRLTADKRLAETVDRRGLMRVQTPQVFVLTEILEAHRRLADRHDLTDDASLYEALGWPVAGVVGDERLLKITSQGDLAMVQALLSLSLDEQHSPV